MPQATFTAKVLMSKISLTAKDGNVYDNFTHMFFRIQGSVINNQNGQNSAREIQREFTQDFILIGRLPTCDSIGAVAFIMTSWCK